MGLDYAWIHIIFTIPPALVLSVVLYPVLTKLDVYKILFLVSVAVTYTIPWDSYLIHTRVWTYPLDGVLGPTLFKIPAEELFFFVVQTYMTSLLYILVNKPTLYPIHLFDDTAVARDDARRLPLRKRIGQVLLLCFILSSYYFYSLPSGRGTYLALICIWAGPVLLALWCLAYQPLLTLPRSKTWLPILLPTAYLWVVDTIALLRGTWSIEHATKLGIQVWPGLEIEEALFFLVSNSLVVFGLTAFENAVAVVEAFPHIYLHSPPLPGPRLLLQASFLSPARYDMSRVRGIREALQNLSAKSRSFSLASSMFSGRLRIDLVLLYAFCRVGDDLVDNAASADEAEQWISHLDRFLKTAYSAEPPAMKSPEALSPFQPAARAILSLLPTQSLPSEPLFALLEGFRSDLNFSRINLKGVDSHTTQFPIRSAADLETYASRVASTVALLCLNLVYYHDPTPADHSQGAASAQVRKKCLAAGAKMGLALQYTNIARDVQVDAEDGRCYLPTDWLLEKGLTPEQVIRTRGKLDSVVQLRKRLLDDAFAIYEENRDAIEDLPSYARAGIRVAVESYMEIGRILMEKIAAGEPLDDAAGGGRRHRATVPKFRRLLVGWRALAGFRSWATQGKQE